MGRGEGYEWGKTRAEEGTAPLAEACSRCRGGLWRRRPARRREEL